jgi:hypothetical protein
MFENRRNNYENDESDMREERDEYGGGQDTDKDRRMFSRKKLAGSAQKSLSQIGRILNHILG